VTIKNAVVNTGKFEVTSGTLTVAGAVSGAGKVYIAAGTADFQAGFNQTVAFIGTSGELELADSQDYAGEIGGFSLTGGTSLDLGDIGFTSGVTTANFVENGNGAFGTLTVTDGTHTANIRLVGDFASSTFTTKSDGHGGTIVTDPAKSTAAVRSFVDAMAGFAPGAGPGTASPVEAGWSPQPLLAAAQPIGAAARRAT
jgi:hypothetical protein